MEKQPAVKEQSAISRLDYWAMMVLAARTGQVPEHDCSGEQGCSVCSDVEVAKEELTAENNTQNYGQIT